MPKSVAQLSRKLGPSEYGLDVSGEFEFKPTRRPVTQSNNRVDIKAKTLTMLKEA